MMENFHLLTLLARKAQNMKRNLGIDLLRSLSILYIVGFWHLLDYTKAIPHYENIISYRITWIVLGTFVLISGYFLGGKNFSRNALFAFYKKRLIKIYPPYFVAVLFFSIFGLSDTITSLKAIFGVSMFVRPAPPTLWFITMLLFFYLITPIIVFLADQGIFRYLFSYIFLFCCLLGYEYLSKALFHYYYLDIRVAVYLAPFMVGVYMARNNIKKNRIKSILSMVGMAAFILSCYFNYESRGYNLLLSIPIITIFPLLMLLFFKQLNLTSLTAQRTIFFLSTASYFMYLFHRPFYIVIKKIYFPTDTVYQLIFLLIICLPIIIASSFFMQVAYNNVLKSLTNRYT